MTDDLMMSDGVTAEIQRRLQNAEREMRLVALELDSNRATEVLVSQDAWKVHIDSLNRIIAHETEKMLTDPMDAHELGWRQGFIRAMRCLTKKQPFSPEEVAERQRKMQNLRDRITAERNLLD